MDELPAIIHRLSLRLWGPEGRPSDEEQTPTDNTEQAASDGPGQDPLASPPQDPVDSLGNALNESEIASLSLDSSVETHSLFSQKNLLRLAALTDSQRTLSLFTPAISQVVYRAWTSPSDLNDFPASVMSPLSPALSRTQSHVGSLSSAHETASTVSLHSRPSLSSHSFSGSGLNLASGRHSKSHSRRRKKRVVDLRKPKTTDDAMSVSDDGTHTESSAPPSIYSAPLPIVNELADDPVTPPLSPEADSHLPSIPERHRASLSRPTLRRPSVMPREDSSYAMETVRAPKNQDVDATPRPVRNTFADDKADAGPSRGPLPATVLPFTQDDKDHVDPALVERLAGEIARRMRDEKLMGNNPCSNFWARPQDDAPPPAYGH